MASGSYLHERKNNRALINLIFQIEGNYELLPLNTLVAMNSANKLKLGISGK